MRLRNVKNKEQILNSSEILIKNPQNHQGKWQQVFDNKNPIYVEIGMGKGQFLLNQAKQNSDINYLGIEHFDNVIVRAIDKIDQAHLPNLKLIRMDALNIDEVFNHEISLLYLNFPDPWPKKRHAKRRLISEDFLTKYEKIFKKSKQINLRTDNEVLFAYATSKLIEYHYKLANVTLDLQKTKKDNHISTEYEDKFVQEGKKILELLATKD